MMLPVDSLATVFDNRFQEHAVNGNIAFGNDLHYYFLLLEANKVEGEEEDAGHQNRSGWKEIV